MKGHTKIILTNVETGEQEIREDDNLITNALDKIINIHMGINLAPNDQNLLPIATQALGGIMLFDGELTEDPDNIHFPTEAHLVGYASVDVNSNDTYRGSWNSVESGKTMTGYTSVWDFGTSQANGTIKSVARTNRWAGQNPLYWYRANGYWTTGNGTPASDRDWWPIRYDGEYVYALKGNSSTHVMRLARIKIPMLRFGVADYSGVARTYEVIASWSTEVTSYTYWDYADHYGTAHEQYCYADSPWFYEDGHDGYIYCMSYGARRPYHSYEYDITYFTINYGDGSYDKSEVHRLSTGLSYWTDQYQDELWKAGRWFGHVHQGVLYRLRSNRKIIDIIPLNNVAAYRSISIIQDSVSDYIENFDVSRPHNGGVYFEVYHYTSTSYNRLNGILYPDGIFILPPYSYQGTGNNHSSDYKYRDYGFTTDDDLTSWGRYDGEQFTRLWEANYLGTINNLASAIVKTPAQTMKIVYTLTDIDEEDEGNGSSGSGGEEEIIGG